MVQAVELSLIFAEDLKDEVLLCSYYAQLTSEERDYAWRYRVERDRINYVAARIGLREILSRHAPVVPEDWQFASNVHGKPYVIAPISGRHLMFSITHTSGLTVIALTSGMPIGVDVERRDRYVNLELADRFFGSREAATLRTMPKSEQRGRFLGLWTLMESFIKAKGQGLSIPLNALSFDLSNWGCIRFSVDASVDEDARAWRFWQLSFGAEHIGAICVQQGSDGLTVSAERLVPGLFHEQCELNIERQSFS